VRGIIALLVATGCCLGAPAGAQSPATIGVVLMHGKGGSPSRHVSDLAAALQVKSVLVANLEMPWSGRRNYDADVASAERSVQDALDGLRAKGATRVFVSGHSFGGTFAFYLGGRLAVDGVVPIAPGGHAGSIVFREKLGPSLEEARQYVAQGKGAEPQRLMDFEGSRGLYPVIAVPAAYVSWFDPEGAMNQIRSAQATRVPVLLVVPKRDYQGLLRIKDLTLKALPPNPHTRLYEPDSDHMGAPAAAAEEMLRWMREVAGAAR
jgi:pimeloyl-ACP methyl ester carboxylesterase